MLNRFKNAIYGSSAASEDITSVRIEYEYNETIIPRRIRSTLFRSPSFRDDILRDTNNKTRASQGDQHYQDDLDIGRNAGQRLIRRSATSDRLDGGNNHSSQQSNHGGTDDSKRHNNDSKAFNKQPKFRYSRPEFLQLKTEDEILVSADHQIRPIILPRDVYSLPWRSGYAECINAGKSLRNEDQAIFYQDIAVKKVSTIEEMDEESSCNLDESIPMQSQLPWVYFGIFDGHAGSAVAVAAAAQLHNIIGEKLRQIADLLIALEFDDDPNEDDADEYADCVTGAIEVRKDSEQKEEPQSAETSKETKQDDNEQDNNCETTANISSSSSSSSDSNENNNLSKADDNVTGSSSATSNELDVKKEEVSVLSTYDIAAAMSIEDEENENLRRKKLEQSERIAHTIIQLNPAKNLPKMIDICRNNITVDGLIRGALESAFWEMDLLIGEDKHDYKMPGGCTAIVSLFILGKLYTCNAGDSRAIVYKNNQVIPMSFDFTPTSERERILRLGQQRPEFLGNDFTHLEFIKRPTRKDLGKQMLYKDAYMTGWSMKTITYDDLKFPLVWGEGKRSRVLATIGVTRGFGDHELKAQYGSVYIKPFLTPEPEVKIMPLETDDTLKAEDVLIMGSDGLWDVTSNEKAAEIVRQSFDLFLDNEETRSKYRYITAAQDLVIHSRGNNSDDWSAANLWRISRTGSRYASLDDIAVFVIPLKQYRDEYLEWKRLRHQAINTSSSSSSSSNNKEN